MSKSVWILIFIGIFFGIIFWSLASQQIESEVPYYLKMAILRTTVVDIHGVKIQSEVAKSDKDKIKGLSGRESLPENKGMLFVFSQPGVYTITMKGMKFPLDIIWIKDNTVVNLTSGATVPTADNIPEYQPITEVNYILEVNKGFIGSNNIRIGDEVKTGLSKSQ